MQMKRDITKACIENLKEIGLVRQQASSSKLKEKITFSLNLLLWSCVFNNSRLLIACDNHPRFAEGQSFEKNFERVIR